MVNANSDNKSIQDTLEAARIAAQKSYQKPVNYKSPTDEIDAALARAAKKQAAEEKKAAKKAAEEAAKYDANGKKRRFWRITRHAHWKATVAIIAVVLIIGGAGFWVWHNTPEFCDAICHNPQDPYNPTYYAEPGESATDKWGNKVEDASSMLSATHREYGNLVCIDCHIPTMAEQVTEGLRWVAGSYYNPLSERSLENLVAYRNITGEEFCLNESCHNLTKSDLKEATAVYERNPHEFHHTEYTCDSCHKSHRASIMVCTECHSDAETPESWLTVEEARNLNTIYGAYDLEKLYK